MSEQGTKNRKKPCGDRAQGTGRVEWDPLRQEKGLIIFDLIGEDQEFRFYFKAMISFTVTVLWFQKATNKIRLEAEKPEATELAQVRMIMV